MEYVTVMMDDAIEIACFHHFDDATDWLLSDDAQIFWDQSKMGMTVKLSYLQD